MVVTLTPRAASLGWGRSLEGQLLMLGLQVGGESAAEWLAKHDRWARL